MIFPVDTKRQIYSFPNFTGGLTSRQAQDNEHQTLINIEPQRDGSMKSIWGSSKINSTSIGSGQPTDMFMGTVANNNFITCIATSTPKIYVAVTSSFEPTFSGAFVDKTPISPIPGNGLYFSFCQSALSNNTPIILAGNNTDGLFYYDNSSVSVFTDIPGVPVDPTAVSQYWGYTVICRGNSIYFSEYADPLTWPVSQEVTLSGQFGEAQQICTFPGKVIVFCRNGIVSVEGNDVDFLSKPIPFNTHIGSAFPMTISTHGNDIGFLHYTGPYITNSGEMSVTYIGEPIREFFTCKQKDLDLSETSRYYWRGHLDKHHYFLTGPKISDPAKRVTLVYDRRLNTWFEIQPPTNHDITCFHTTELSKVTIGEF